MAKVMYEAHAQMSKLGEGEHFLFAAEFFAQIDRSPLIFPPIASIVPYRSDGRTT